MAKKRGGILFAHSGWDFFLVLATVLQAGFLAGMIYFFPWMTWWQFCIAGFVYAVAIDWNVNAIAHNFLHNQFFTSRILNRAFSLFLSVTNGFSQQFYDQIHRRHHMGNADKPEEDHGDTTDWLSIYKHGHDGEAESVWTYTFLAFFRDDPKITYREIAKRSKFDARWGIFEIVCFALTFTGFFILNWKFMLAFLPVWYLGHCFSYLNGYYLHYGADPDTPLAWGVSCYNGVYNWFWFNSGYHAEHHYRPKLHWTKMKELHRDIKGKQAEAGTRSIVPPHALGWLDPSLPERSIPLLVQRAEQEKKDIQPAKA